MRRGSDMSELRMWLYVLAAFPSLLGLAAPGIANASDDQAICDLGSRRELFVDSYLIDRLSGAQTELQRPVSGGTAIAYDRPYEGVFAFYTTIIKDGDKFRMYYR